MLTAAIQGSEVPLPPKMTAAFQDKFLATPMADAAINSVLHCSLVTIRTAKVLLFPVVSVCVFVCLSVCLSVCQHDNFCP